MTVYVIVWTSETDTENRRHEVEAANEREARAKFDDYLRTHYEDEVKDSGVKVISVTPKASE